MPKGDNPNSRKNLQKGKSTQFKKGEKRAKESIERQKQTLANRRTFKEQLEVALKTKVTLRDKNGNVKESTVYEHGIEMLMRKFNEGDLRTIEFVRDSVGEKPAENIVISNIDPDVISEIESMVYDS